MKHIALCLFLLALPLSAAEPVSITRSELDLKGETNVATYRFVHLSASGPAATDAAFDFDVSPEGQIDLIQSGGEIWFVGPPGQYRVKVISVRLVGGKPKLDRAVVTVTIGAGPL